MGANLIRGVLFLLVGALGMAMYSCTAHLWIDHLNLHTLIDLTQHARRAQAPDQPQGQGKRSRDSRWNRPTQT